MSNISKSKSTPMLTRKEDDELSILSEVDYDEKDVEVDKQNKKQKLEPILKIVQLSIYLASFGSIFYNKVPNIMNQISNQLKNVFSLSPSLIQRSVTQATINSAMSLLPLCVLFCFLFKKCHILSENQLQRPLHFFEKIMVLMILPYSLHFGESLGFYIFSSRKESIIVLLSVTFSYIIFIFSFICLSNLNIINYHEKTLFYIGVQQIPALIKFTSAALNVSANKTSAVIAFCCIMFPVSIFFIYYLKSKTPFVEQEWNTRGVATILSSMVFYIINVINYFVPDLSAWTITFGFIIVASITILEFGKLPTITLKKRTKRREKKQAYSEGLDDMPTQQKRPLIKLMLQDYVTLAYFFTAIIIMTCFNAEAARNMPVGEPLPDVVHTLSGNLGAEIRGAPVFTKMQFSNLVCMVSIIGLFIIAAISPETTNGRKVFLIYGTMCFIRTLAFWLTTLPAPCSGLPNCPCGDAEELAKVRQYPPLKIAFIWTFGFGMFAKIPQCGDLIVSGHTMFMWLTFKWIIQTTRRMVKRTTADTVAILCVWLFIMSITYISLSRNHYTVDVFFGYIVAEGTYTLYDYYEKKIETTDNTILVRILRWLEIRIYPIVKTEYDEDDDDIVTDFEA